MASTADKEKDMRDKLLRNVKKEVKQIMEEAVTRKFVHEESSSITTFCSAVESCVQHGLRKRALGLFKNSTTTALLHKVSKNFEPAAHVIKLCTEIENNNENTRRTLDSNKNQPLKKTSYHPKYLWIRLALFEKHLAKILDFLVENNHKYYEKEALVADPVDGPILASLLVGPCALDFTKMKTADHYWTDPPADELVQRHRIHSSGQHHIRADSPKRPGLQVRRHTSSSSEESARSAPLSAKEYVESLHQNSKSTLLYGKNNVLVQPKEDVESLAGYLSLHQGPEGLTVKWTPNQLMNGCCEEEESHVDRRPIYAKYSRSHSINGVKRKFLYWDYAVTIYMDEIVYLHCHQQPDSGGTIVLVGQDGVQRPPIHFPKGGHLLAFLSCMENGLLPHGQLDPPLWSQRGRDNGLSILPRQLLDLNPVLLSTIDEADETAEESMSNWNKLRKVFPKLKRKGSRMSQLSGRSEDKSLSMDEPPGGATVGSTLSQTLEEEEEATDYVFRIINAFRPEHITADMLDPKARGEKTERGEKGGSSGGSSTSSLPYPWSTRPEETQPSPGSASRAPHPPFPSSIQSYARSQEEYNTTCIHATAGHRSAVKQLCDTMTRQILSRAFYGWLSYCRHLKTVRTHLSGLVNHKVVAVDNPTDASSGLTVELWETLSGSGVLTAEVEVYRLVYYGGCEHSIRKEAWPYLLGHYKFGSTAAERVDDDNALKGQYENTMSEWLAVEAIVRQRDKEVMAANLAKLSQESTDGHIPLIRKDSSLSNDVFESVDSDDFSHPETVPEESSSAVTPNSPTPVPSEPSGSRAGSRPGSRPGSCPGSCPGSRPGSTSQAGTGAGAGAGVAGGEGVKGESLLHQALSSVRSAEGKDVTSPDEGIGDSIGRHDSDSKRSDSCDTDRNVDALRSESDDVTSAADVRSILVTNPTMDAGDEAAAAAAGGDGDLAGMDREGDAEEGDAEATAELRAEKLLSTSEDGDHLQLSASRESLISPASPVSNASNGGIYSAELLDNVALNLHRIDKDVQRCDRNYSYFNPTNLDKLRNVMCTYVWEHLDVGYVQGMCDLVAPLLVVLDDEAKTYSCFCHLMKRMSNNFPQGGAMDQHFANMRSLIQILDPELFEHMHQNGDYTHFYFCYRWFLLDFKRELVYDDVFSVWETIWAAKCISSPHYVLFIALALVQYYREIIIDNCMDFTDIIKFFNEMAERHNAKQVLGIARDLVYKLQDLIESK